jgi:hypothetical protein
VTADGGSTLLVLRSPPVRPSGVMVAKVGFRVEVATQKAHDAAADAEERDVARADAKCAADTWFHNGSLHKS